MKVKLHIALTVFALMLFLTAMSGYGHPSDSSHRETRGNITLENPLSIPPVDKAKLGPELAGNSAVENPPNKDTEGSMVSKWLEARATEEAGAKTAAEADPSSIDEEMFMGGGWCNSCGCWLRHGCDSNGNCNLGHYWNCTSTSGDLGCSLHSGSCVSSG